MIVFVLDLLLFLLLWCKQKRSTRTYGSIARIVLHEQYYLSSCDHARLSQNMLITSGKAIRGKYSEASRM